MLEEDPVVHSGRIQKCIGFLALMIGAIAIAAVPSAAQEGGSIDLANMRGVWTKVCGAAKVGPTCFTTADFGRDGSIRLALAVYDTPGKSKLLRAMVPLGTLETQKIRVSEDGRPIVALRYVVCNSKACFAEARITNAEVRRFADSSELQLTLEDRPSKHVTFNLPVAGFQTAFQGDGISEEQAHQLVEPE